MSPLPTALPKLTRIRCTLAVQAAFVLFALPLGAQEQVEVVAAEVVAVQPAEQPAAEPANENQLITQELLANSPFMSKAFKERLAKSDTSRTRDLIFRGFAGDGDKWLICVYNNQSKQSEWVELGAQVNGITIAEFDKEGLRIKVVKDATSTFLNLEQPK